MIVKRGEYQGKKTLSFCTSEDDRWPVTMGARKLAAIVANIPETLKFLNEEGGDDGKKAVTEFYKSFYPADSGTGKKKAKAEKATA